MKNFKGLLPTEGEREQAVYQGLLDLGQAIGTGYTDRPVSFAQRLGAGGRAFGKGVRGSLQDSQMRKLREMQAQQQQMQLDMNKKRMEQLANPQVSFSKNVIWGTDDKGNVALGSVGDDGSFRVIDTKGFKPQRSSVTLRDIGGEIVGFDAQGNPVSTIKTTLPPEQEPSTKFSQAEQAALGKAAGESQATSTSELSGAESALPTLEAAVTKLKDLGQKATYTYAGQGADFIKRQLGLDVGEGAEARAAYIAHVNNIVLPLLKQTFGASFTEKEGQQLKATLGDVNLSPLEKDAALEAFISNKRAEIERMKRSRGGQGPIDVAPLPNFNFGDIPPPPEGFK